MKILHIGPDSQFIQFAAEDFEYAAPACNDYVIVTKGASLNYQIKYGTVRILQSNAVSFARFIKLIRFAFIVRKYNVIISHALTLPGMVALLVAPKRSIRFWSGWGAEYYGRGYADVRQLLGDRTRTVADLLVKERKLLIAKQSVVKKQCLKFLRSAAVAKVDLFSAPIPDDYDVMRKVYPKFSGRYVDLQYGSVEREFRIGAGVKKGTSVLVGNSASIENNHPDIFVMLSNQDLAGRDVIVPLSYGDPAYRQAILEYGYELLGSRFCPLRDFMPLNEYVKVVASCSVVIMGHQRQAATATIGTALYSGAKVYLDEHCTTYKFLVRKGAVIGTLQQLQHTALPKTPLLLRDVEQNRQVVESFWGGGIVRSNVKRLLADIYRQMAS